MSILISAVGPPGGSRCGDGLQSVKLIFNTQRRPVSVLRHAQPVPTDQLVGQSGSTVPHAELRPFSLAHGLRIDLGVLDGRGLLDSE
jgi:hypothetical protein